MFLGEYAHTLDTKSRLAIPARFRTLLSEGVVITRGYDYCVMGMALPDWQKLAAKVSDLPPGEIHTRNLQRLLFSAAVDYVLDQQGRIVLPQQLREYAFLSSDDVTVVGVNRYFEIWSPQRWRETSNQMAQDTNLLVSQLSGLKA